MADSDEGAGVDIALKRPPAILELLDYLEALAGGNHRAFVNTAPPSPGVLRMHLDSLRTNQLDDGGKAVEAGITLACVSAGVLATLALLATFFE